MGYVLEASFRPSMEKPKGKHKRCCCALSLSFGVREPAISHSPAQPTKIPSCTPKRQSHLIPDTHTHIHTHLRPAPLAVSTPTCRTESMLNSRSFVLAALTICCSAVRCAAFAVPSRLPSCSKYASRPPHAKATLVNRGGYARTARGVQGLSASIPSVSFCLCVALR